MNKGNEFNNSYLRGLTGQPVKKPKRIIDEVIETASADPVIVRVSEDNPLYDYRASGTGMTLKGDGLIGALGRAGVDWRKATEKQIAGVPIVKAPNDFVLRDTRVEPISPVVKAVVRQDIPLEPTGNSILGKIINGEQWELKDGRWRPALPSEAEVYGTNVNYEHDPVAEGDIDGPRMVVAENTADYGTPKTTIVEQIIERSKPKDWKRIVPEILGQWKVEGSRRYGLDKDLGLKIRRLRDLGMMPITKDLDILAIDPDGIPDYGQPVEVEIAQVMPENVPQKPSYKSMILENLRQKVLGNIDNLAVDDIRTMGPMVGAIPEDTVEVMPGVVQRPSARSIILDDLRQKTLDRIDGLAADDMRMGPMLGAMPAEGMLNDADNPRLAGALLQDPRVRLGLAGAGGAGLLALIAHTVGQNREERRRAAEAQLNYPIGYDNGY